MLIKAKESVTKGKLGAFRSALSLYFADTDGTYITYPVDLVPKYIDKIPNVSVPTAPEHPSNNGIIATNDISTVLADWIWTDFGTSYIYNWESGVIVLNCTHIDTKGAFCSLW
jgi:hypothetical protein